MEMIKLIENETITFNLWEDVFRKTWQVNHEQLKVMYQLKDGTCFEMWILGLAQMSYDYGHSYVCYAQNRIVVLQQYCRGKYPNLTYKYVLEKPLVEYCTIPELDLK